MTLFDTTCRIPFYSTNSNGGVLLLCFRLTDYALVMIARVMGRVYLQKRQKQLLLNKIAPFSLATAGWLKEEETVKWRERFSQDNQDRHAQVSVMGILGGLCHAWLVRFVNILYICQQLFRKGPYYKRRHRMKMAELDLLVQQNINMPPNQYVTNQTTK